MDLAKASPTKAFFVSMLTRDISLADAILDLIDNSLDGALRESGPDVDYSRYWASVHTAPDRFEIRDNCGGIPRATAINYAFKMGREPGDHRDDAVETIGMYGIGMKRALFKIGDLSTVVTRTGDDQFKVRFTPEWLSDVEWSDLPLETPGAEEQLTSSGTAVVVEKLNKSIRAMFGSSEFEEELRRGIGEHFSVFIEKGFKITLNDKPVVPSIVKVLLPTGDLLRPYFCSDEIEETKVTVIVGVNKRVFRADSDEELDPSKTRRGTLPEAGWTIYCNDRAVLVGDVSRLTGWGDALPSFHPQFSVLTGMVEFRAKDAGHLPITTTKRALDTSSETWLITRKMMTDGMRAFVNYTNWWKNEGRPSQQAFFEGATEADIRAAAETMAPLAQKRFDHRETSALYNPAKSNGLPKPEKAQPANGRITFYRPKKEIQFLGEQLLGNESAPARDVGDACFERVLAEERDE